MDKRFLENLLNDVAAGRISTEKAMESLKLLPFEDIDFASLDHHRSLRTGYPEVVFCQGKTAAQTAEIMKALSVSCDTVMGTRAAPSQYAEVKKTLAETGKEVAYFEEARIIRVGGGREADDRRGKIAVVTAGTADIPVAEEAAVTAETLGNRVDRVYDVGVAGIHRLFAKLETIRAANVVIVVAGMEGALASVVGGLVDKPVIAVPTSVGYGANLRGLSALLSMLNSCANGVATVNIDNGFGAGYMSSVINDLARRE